MSKASAKAYNRARAKTYTNPVYDYIPARELHSKTTAHHPIIIVGAGPCGLAAALDFAIQGMAVIVLDDNNTVSVGSRAICFAKRTLEIMDRYGCARPMLAKGITWQRGKVYFQNDELYQFDLLPEGDHKLPAFINLQQYYFEEYMIKRCADFADMIDLRWKHKVTDVTTNNNNTTVQVDTPDGCYQLSCDYLLVADGANSKIRKSLGLQSKGQIFEDHFLIADIVMKTDFPAERRFWFDPPFHPNQSVLLHKQADNVWRIDFQLGWDADKEQEVKAENIIPRVRAMLGDDVEFELEWASVYTFQCRKMDDFIFHRVIFIGDAAHQVSPFGARGANGGIQSAENLTWKIIRILRGSAPPALLTTYNTERQPAASDNILNSTRSTDFITPKNHISRVFRDETLRLAKTLPFARPLINSGRLSVPYHYRDSPLNTPDSQDFNGGPPPGSPAKDAPLIIAGQSGWLLERLGNRFVCMLSANTSQTNIKTLTDIADLDILLIGDNVIDNEGILNKRYDLRPGTVYLFRPDQIVAARWRHFDKDNVIRAMRRALGFELENAQLEKAQ